MKELPCKRCKYYKRFSTGAVSCYAVKQIDFYWLSIIDEMLAKCPMGWRGKKVGKSDFDYYRDYKEVHRYQ